MLKLNIAQTRATCWGGWAAALSALALSACTSTTPPALSEASETPQAPSAPAIVTEGPTPDTSKAERDIVDIAWMNGDFSRQITEAVTCQDIGVLVTTRGYAEGEDIHITVGEQHGSKERDVELVGKVEADGKARVKWPAMGCVDNMPTPLLGGSTEKAPAADSPRSPKKKVKQKTVAGKPSNLSPRKEKSTPFDDPATMIDPPRSAMP